MKKLYTSPVVTVEELTKIDVLCESTGGDTPTPPTKTQRVFEENVIADMSSVL